MKSFQQEKFLYFSFEAPPPSQVKVKKKDKV